jgi:signal transduction histidine kinase
VRSLAERARCKGLELTCHVAPDVPPILVGDPDRLRQILVNLIGNAVKFTERGGVLVRVKVRDQTADTVELLTEVVDTGIGIPTEALERIFSPFDQADASTTRRLGVTSFSGGDGGD